MYRLIKDQEICYRKADVQLRPEYSRYGSDELLRRYLYNTPPLFPDATEYHPHLHQQILASAMTSLSGAVASEQVRASVIGGQILELGGNAVDAIIATIIAVNTLAPFHSDLGGGGFAIIRESNGSYEALDFRHIAPVNPLSSPLEKGKSWTDSEARCHYGILREGSLDLYRRGCCSCTRSDARTLGASSAVR